MDTPKAALDALLLVVLRMVDEAWPDDLGYHVGMAMGQILQDHESQESTPEQALGEWRSYDCDGYKFRIRRNQDGQLEIGREEQP